MPQKNPRFSRIYIAVLAAALLAGCRQADGPIPQPVGEQDNKISDISKDLQAVARGEGSATSDLNDDLGNLGPDDPPRQLIANLAAALGNALRGAPLTDEVAGRLSRQLFVAVTARELSERQGDAVQQDIFATLADAKVPTSQARPVTNAVAELQNEIGTNVRRWWQRR